MSRPRKLVPEPAQQPADAATEPMGVWLTQPLLPRPTAREDNPTRIVAPGTHAVPAGGFRMGMLYNVRTAEKGT